MIARAIIICLVLCLLRAGQYLDGQKFWGRFRKWTRSSHPPKSSPTVKHATPPGTQLSLRDSKPYEFPPIRMRTSSKVAMGLRRLDSPNWLTIDSNYLPEHTLRKHLLNTSRSQVIQVLPPSLEACHEVLSTVTTFLSSRFPQHFILTPTTIYNRITNETFSVGPSCANPLETAASLAMEDFNVLLKNPETGEYHLMASATLFPAGWRLEERIGTSMAKLHAPVPGWKENLGANVNRYFDHLSHKTSMERSNLFIQCTPDLFQDAPETEALISACNTAPPENLVAKDVKVRRERQTFTRLPKTGAVLFTVRTFMRSLMDIGNEELKALRSQIRGWPEDIKVYKGAEIWGDVLEEWCQSRLGDMEEEEEEVEVEQRVGGGGMCPV